MKKMVILIFVMFVSSFGTVSLANARPHHYKHHTTHHPHHTIKTDAIPQVVARGSDRNNSAGDVSSNESSSTYTTPERRTGGSKFTRIATAGWGGDLVAKARSYMGTNPTGWARLWCGRFMAMIAPSAAAKIRNPNMAASWAELPHTTAHVGAIAVMGRRGGGHVGVVTGFDERGNPVIISGNHGHTVGEGIYAKGRIHAYVEG